MAETPESSGAKKPDSEKLRRELIEKLSEIDPETLTSLAGKTREGETGDPQWYVWTVWRR